METIGTDDSMTLDGNKSLPSSTQSKEIVDVTKIDIIGAPKESTDTYSNAMMVEETENSTSATQLKVIMDHVEINNVDSTKESTDIKEMGSAEVPMKNMVDIDVPMENVVDAQVDFIKLKGYMMSFPPKTILVRIEDVWLTRRDLECLLHARRWLHGEVITAYIYYLRTQEDSLKRAGGNAFLENTDIAIKLKRDGGIPISPVDHPRIIQRVVNYLNHDMLLVPINVPNCHWYLCHIDGKNGRIYVLDSFGVGFNRTDLRLTLKGLQNYFMIASQNSEFNIGNKWVDLRVTEWPIIEYFQEKKQFDGSSCGLFMLQFMEYFTGEDLALDVTQEGIEAFREHIAIILHESVLNEIRGKPVYETIASNSDASNSDASDSDCMIVDNSNGLELPGGVGEKCHVPVHSIPTDQHELYKGLCKQIMSIQDAKCLEKEWVRSSQPYLIGLSLRKIQNIIRMDQPMDTDCFNLAIRIVACDEILQMVETDVHYMDLRFSTSMADSTQGDKWRKKPNVRSLATLLNSWPGVHYSISSRKLIFLPSASMGHFVLFSIDKDASCVYVLDPVSVAASPPDSKMKWKHNMELRLLRISIYLNDALAIAEPCWNSDIFSWPRTSFGVPNISSMNLSGYLVFYIMLSWNGKTLVHKIFTDGFKLRKKFLLHLLKYDGNEAQDNIPDIVRQYLNSIKEYI